MVCYYGNKAPKANSYWGVYAGASEGVKYWGGQRKKCQKVDPLKIRAVKSDKQKKNKINKIKGTVTYRAKQSIIAVSLAA